MFWILIFFSLTLHVFQVGLHVIAGNIRSSCIGTGASTDSV